MMERDAFRADERGMLFATAFGPCGVAWNDGGLTRLQLPERDGPATERRLQRRAEIVRPGEAPEWVAWAVVALQRYFAGRPVDFAGICLDLSGCSGFHQRIYEALRGIGWGKTTTYGALAAQVGSPDAARAIGQAMGRNPLPIIVPCHRVLASGGKIGGFSAHGGATTKERLLELEGVARQPNAPPLLALMQPQRN
jgi:methylated-DNA-[protein]-cysteine S-methyltransferase